MRHQENIKRWKRLGFSTLTVACFAGCSLVNSFDEVTPQIDDGNTGTGGDMGSGGSDMGGASSGGTDNMGGETGSGGNGTGGTVVAEPGLVLAIEAGDELTNDVLYAISPQDGTELATDIADYKTAAYEPERDIWFFVRDDKLAAAQFDRIENEWTFLTDDGPEVLVTDFTEQFFALNERLAVKVGTKLQVFNTEDPSDIQFEDEVDYPTGTLWGAAAARKSVGGNIDILTKECPGGVAPCNINLTSVAVTDAVVQVTGTVAVDSTYDNAPASARGNIRYDVGTELLAVLVPQTDAGPLPRAYLYSADTLNDAGDFSFQQAGNQIGTFDIDPCHSVAYTMGPLSQDLSAFALNDDGGNIPLLEPVNLTGRRVVYEPYTRSLILIEDEAADFGLNAYSLTGTISAPDVRKRITDWSPPTLRPKFVTAATVDQVGGDLCN